MVSLSYGSMVYSPSTKQHWSGHGLESRVKDRSLGFGM